MVKVCSVYLFVIVIISSGVTEQVPPSAAQSDTAPCGVVDDFAWPVPDIDVKNPDFAIYRARFGGLHTGIDVAFEQLGMPVQAAARGIVTYSDPEGWDTEKGVVVVEHTMPDGTLVNTLYGHMEQLNGYYFPQVDDCVELGDIVGAVGYPSRGLPHLHYEVRTRYRYEGGPGYTDVNPMELGWLHPVDFTYLARVWVLPAYRDHFTVIERPTLPPLVLSNGAYVLVHSGQLASVTAQGDALWSFDTLGSVTGVLELADGRVLAVNSTDQVLVLNQGSYSALWNIPASPESLPLRLGDHVAFVVEGGAVMAFSPEGVLQWETALDGEAQYWAVGPDNQLAVATGTNTLWVLDARGTVVYQTVFDAPPVPFAGPGNTYTILSDSTIWTLDTDWTLTTLVDTERAFTANAELLAGPDGVLYLYTGEGRALYAYAQTGELLWIAYMPGSHVRPPLLGVGGGQRLYALTFDGQMLAFDTGDGRLVQQLALYNGGDDGTSIARWLDVAPDDTVRFNSGYLTYLTLDGLALGAN